MTFPSCTQSYPIACPRNEEASFSTAWHHQFWRSSLRSRTVYWRCRRTNQWKVWWRLAVTILDSSYLYMQLHYVDTPQRHRWALRGQNRSVLELTWPSCCTLVLLLYLSKFLYCFDGFWWISKPLLSILCSTNNIYLAVLLPSIFYFSVIFLEWDILVIIGTTAKCDDPI